MYHASTLSGRLSGLGAVRLPFLGYHWFTGHPYYRPVNYAEAGGNLPPNCSNGGGATPRDLPADGEMCLTAQFPFLGRKVYGCGSTVAEGGYGDPYVACEPVILKSEGFDIVTPLIRLGATAACAFVLFGLVRRR